MLKTIRRRVYCHLMHICFVLADRYKVWPSFFGAVGEELEVRIWTKPAVTGNFDLAVSLTAIVWMIVAVLLYTLAMVD